MSFVYGRIPRGISKKKKRIGETRIVNGLIETSEGRNDVGFVTTSSSRTRVDSTKGV